VKTAQPLIELNNLAAIISTNPTSKFYIVNSSVEQIISDLKSHNPSAHEMNECVNRLNQYIDKFFWMTSTDEDLSLPRWKEASSFAVILLKKLVENQNFSTSIEADQIKIREAEEIKARNVLGRGMGRLRILRNRSFWKQVENVKNHSWWREEARYMLSRLYYFVYKAVDVLGSRYVQKKVIKEKSEIYKLTFEELLEYIISRESETIKEKISKYTQMYNMFKNFGPPSTIGGIFHKDEELKRDDTYEGVGCSPGIVRGRARVVNNLTEVDQIQPKEILIVPYTNPGWTPVFSLISGIVMEEGGLLSHGAVVARECGIPAILQIENCTKVIKTGTLIEINGTTGSLIIIE
ncbi:MAG: PEP-utilizing enzyme, partial [Candidatus Heimdallarchaeota archaeon]